MLCWLLYLYYFDFFRKRIIGRLSLSYNIISLGFKYEGFINNFNKNRSHWYSIISAYSHDRQAWGYVCMYVPLKPPKTLKVLCPGFISKNWVLKKGQNCNRNHLKYSKISYFENSFEFDMLKISLALQIKSCFYISRSTVSSDSITLLPGEALVLRAPPSWSYFLEYLVTRTYICT